MNKIKDIHLLAVIVRIFAIFLTFRTLNEAMQVVLSFNQQGWVELSYSYIIYPIITLFFSLYLWFFPMTVAKRILPYKEYKSIEFDGLSYEKLFVVAVTILGLYFFYDSLVNLFYWVYLWITYFGDTQGRLIISIEQKGGTIATVAELILSLILILRTKKLISFFKWLRYSGTD